MISNSTYYGGLKIKIYRFSECISAGFAQTSPSVPERVTLNIKVASAMASLPGTFCRRLLQIQTRH